MRKTAIAVLLFLSALAAGASAQTAPALPNLQLPQPGAPVLPAGAAAALPPGLDVNQLLKQLTAPSAPSATSGAPATQPPQAAQPAASGIKPESDAAAHAANLKAFETLLKGALQDGKIDVQEETLLKGQAKNLGLSDQETQDAIDHARQRRDELVAFLLAQVKLLAHDGALSDPDQRFLEVRARDRGADAKEAPQLIADALERLRKLDLYRSFVKSFLDDGVLDAAEQTRLAAKRAELDVSEQEAKDQLEQARLEVKGQPKDVLQEIRQRDQAAEITTDELLPYGREVFQAGPDSFAPAAGMPPPDAYLLGPGDHLLVSLWGRVEASYNLVVDGEGRVQFPRIGPVRVAGLTYAEARRLLKGKAEAIAGVTAAVSMADMRPVQVIVVGEAVRPGSVTLSPLSTVTHAVMAAGGPTPLGSLRRVLLRRSGKVLATVDLYDFLQKGEAKGDRVLQAGDVVVLPRAEERVWLAGQVKRPAVYELAEAEGLRALLDIAGGLSPDASAGRIQVERAERHESRLVLDVALAKLPGDFPLHDGDRVRVFALKPEVDNQVTLQGHVHNPGPRAFREGMRVSDLVGKGQDLKPDVELGYGAVVRETGPDRARTVLPFRLGAVLDGSEAGENLPLQPRDEVYVFSRDQFRPPLQARASGDVRNPGAYRIERGARAADLVRLAGGLAPEALTSRAELLRYLPDRSRQTLYVNLEKALAGQAADNPELADDDELVVHRVWDQTFQDVATIEGEVKRPGEVPLTQGMTVRDLVFKAGGLTKNAHLPMAHVYRNDRATKEMTIHTFDLGKALDGDPTENLVLSDLDRVTIHSGYEFAPIQKVVLSGMVNKPGDYPYATNMTVRDLILAGGGPLDEAYLVEAEVVRSEIQEGRASETRTIRFALDKALAGEPKENVPLKPYDRILVKRIPEWKDTRKVDIAGEVVFPGSYFIAKGEKLSSVLARAGGYTPDAYLEGAVFTRESARQQQQMRLDDLRDRLQEALLRASSQEVQGALSPEDLIAQKQYVANQQALLKKLEGAKATGRIVLKLLPLAELPNSEWDVALEDTDTLTLPKRPQTIAVLGQVYNPTTLLWEPESRTVSHYLEKTGGPTADAEQGEIYVVRADGSVVSNGSLKAGNWWSRGIERFEMAPGDAILVPERIVRVNYMREIRDITQILYQIAVAAGVAVALF